MSKKPPQSNTLLNYFTSPKGTPKKVVPKAVVESPVAKARVVSKEESDDEIPTTKRRRETALIDSESDHENVTPNKRKSPPAAAQKIKKRRIVKPVKSDSSENEDDSEDALQTSKMSLQDYSFSETKSEDQTVVNKIKLIKKDKPSNIEDNFKWSHEKLEFLKPENIRDANKRKPSDPNYDPKTLYVPNQFLDGLTPAMRQWWLLKSQRMDAVLFFKVGKFYELYHMDATVGVQQLGFSYMRGEFAHSGFPETAYNKMATALVDKGFKVARIEQTETPEMMSERCRQLSRATKFDKVVAREICQVTTKASCVYGAQMPEARSEFGTYLYAIAAEINPDNTSRFGVCFIETSIGTFHLSDFVDDKYCSKLLALFAEHIPGLLLLERNKDYGPFQRIVKTQLKDVRQETLTKSQFGSNAATVLESLHSECYFKDGDCVVWPKLFKEIAEDCVPKPLHEMSLRALGAVHWFLKESCLDIQLFSMKQFEMYDPICANTTRKHVERDYMVVDSSTVHNLSLLGGRGSLQKTLDFCKTPFGKRLLRNFICRPLCNVKKIQLRQETVKELYENQDKLRKCQGVLKTLPDLERQVAKIHTYGNKFCATNHPDGRAIMYEAKTYSKRKIMDLLKTLKGFDAAREIVDIFKDCESRLLRKLTQFPPNGTNVDLTETLQFFKEAFNHEEAEKEGTIIPKKGVEPEYDAIQEQIKEIESETQQYLKEQSKYFGCQLKYFGSDKKRFQLEVPDRFAHRASSDYQLEGKKQGAKRFSTPTTKEFLYELMKAEAERNKLILDLNRRIFEKFSQRYDQWQQVIHCLTLLDFLCALAEYAVSYSGADICMPKVEPFANQPFISIENGKHPCIGNIENFVPNDTHMGTEELAPVLLLTGPNMGGKSTLMRQVSVIGIMAQMGSFVPASQCSLSMIDRIFTRLGASDDIVRGQSTFFVELSEASSILRHASKQSLLIIDELGRGTSTHDGNAIATAYLNKLTTLQCRCLFSTHYHTLVDRFLDDPTVQLGHMACMTSNKSEEVVTLLYKLSKGRCPKSFGFNAARMAGLPDSIVARAREMSEEMEMEDRAQKLFKKIFQMADVNGEVVEMLKNLVV